MKIWSLLVQTALFDGEHECIHISEGKPGIKYLLQEGMPRKRSSLSEYSGLSRYFITMENSKSLYYMTDCFGPLNEVLWLHLELSEELPCSYYSQF